MERRPATREVLADDTPRAGERQGWLLALIVVIIGMFMAVLDINIVNVAVPAMQKSYGVTKDDIEWVVTSYSLMLGVVVPVSGWLGDRIGLRRIYLLTLLAFSVGSALCGVAGNLQVMVCFRILQAVPGGLLPVITLTMISRMVPKEQLGTAMGIYGLGVVVAPAVGPTLGGYLVEYYDWRWIFMINVPIGILGALCAFFLLPRFAPRPVSRFDLLGFLTIASALFALLLALSKGQDWGWLDYPVLPLIAASITLLALFAVIELASAHPLFDLRTLARWQFVNPMLLVLVAFLGFFAEIYLIPVFLQQGQRITPLHTGLTMMPQAVAMASLMPVAGQLYDKIGARIPAFLGLLIVSCGAYLLGNMPSTVGQRQIVIYTWMWGVGVALVMMPTMTAGLSALPQSHDNQASAATNVVQRVGGALGLPALTALATVVQTQAMADRSGLLGAEAPPELAQILGAGFTGAYPVYQRAQLDALATSYRDVFLILAGITALTAPLALLLTGSSRARLPAPH
jgi:EmrB/QacA subfamily drug resistance transporter